MEFLPHLRRHRYGQCHLHPEVTVCWAQLGVLDVGPVVNKYLLNADCMQGTV